MLLTSPLLCETNVLTDRHSPPPLSPVILQQYADLPAISGSQAEKEKQGTPSISASNQSESNEHKTDGLQKKIPKWFKPISQYDTAKVRPPIDINLEK